MKLTQVPPPQNVTPNLDEQVTIRSDGARFEGHYGADDTYYERCTMPDGQIVWYIVDYGG